MRNVGQPAIAAVLGTRVTGEKGASRAHAHVCAMRASLERPTIPRAHLRSSCASGAHSPHACMPRGSLPGSAQPVRSDCCGQPLPVTSNPPGKLTAKLASFPIADMRLLLLRPGVVAHLPAIRHALRRSKSGPRACLWPAASRCDALRRPLMWTWNGKNSQLAAWPAVICSSELSSSAPSERVLSHGQLRPGKAAHGLRCTQPVRQTQPNTNVQGTHCGDMGFQFLLACIFQLDKFTERRQRGRSAFSAQPGPVSFSPW